ncbi:MAG TPA: hypothetical protein VGV65_10640 [Nocardioides sp.]|nr:hypothetical protein [Nocardioides sp.]
MITGQDGVVRLDDATVTTLLDPGSGDLDPRVLGDLDAAGVLAAVETIRRPLVSVEVVVAGAALQVHRALVDPQRAVLLLAVRPGLHQLMVVPPSHLAAALVRMTRTGPRRSSGSRSRPAPDDAAARLLAEDDEARLGVLREVGATLGWRLRVRWDGDHRDLVVLDCADGWHVLDDEEGALLPTSATTLYRVFSTALPPAV